MIAALALMLIAPPVALTELDVIPTAEVDRAARGDASIRAEIGRISGCLRAAGDPSECLARDGCTLPNPSACANVSAEAWRAYSRRYLALLSADATVGPVAKASQVRWEESARSDCAIGSAVSGVRKWPYAGYLDDVCLAEAAQTRALALRDHVVNLYGDASVQGGEPYPGPSPFAATPR